MTRIERTRNVHRKITGQVRDLGLRASLTVLTDAEDARLRTLIARSERVWAYAKALLKAKVDEEEARDCVP